MINLPSFALKVLQADSPHRAGNPVPQNVQNGTGGKVALGFASILAHVVPSVRSQQFSFSGTGKSHPIVIQNKPNQKNVELPAVDQEMTANPLPEVSANPDPHSSLSFPSADGKISMDKSGKVSVSVESHPIGNHTLPPPVPNPKFSPAGVLPAEPSNVIAGLAKGDSQPLGLTNQLLGLQGARVDQTHKETQAVHIPNSPQGQNPDRISEAFGDQVKVGFFEKIVGDKKHPVVDPSRIPANSGDRDLLREGGLIGKTILPPGLQQVKPQLDSHSGGSYPLRTDSINLTNSLFQGGHGIHSGGGSEIPSMENPNSLSSTLNQGGQDQSSMGQHEGTQGDQAFLAGRQQGQGMNPLGVDGQNGKPSFLTHIDGSLGTNPPTDRGGSLNLNPPQRLQMDVTLGDATRIQIDVAVQNRQVSANLLMDHSSLRNLVLQNQTQLDSQLAGAGLELREFEADVREQGTSDQPWSQEARQESGQAPSPALAGNHSQEEPRSIIPQWNSQFYFVA